VTAVDPARSSGSLRLTVADTRAGRVLSTTDYGVVGPALEAAVAGKSGRVVLVTKSALILHSTQAQDASLYQDAFKTQGLKGWITRGAGAWILAPKGMMHLDGAAEGEALAPFRIDGTRDFAAQATVKVGAQAIGSEGEYGLVVRATGQPFSGVRGGLSYAMNLGQTVPLLMWGQDQAGGRSRLLPPCRIRSRDLRELRPGDDIP
jgi:hypothetical protein